jgi:hypothetical protein
MIYHDIPLIIPILAAGYVLTIYLLLMLAQRSTKLTRLSQWRIPSEESRTSLR